MNKHKASLLGFIVCIASVGTAAMADDLPKSGKFSLHTGYKTSGDDLAQISPERMLISGMFYGVTFNDQGNGLFHNGWTICTYSGEIGGASAFKGECAWYDADGDVAYADYEGRFLAGGEAEGINRMNGGTGKLTGIKAQGPFRCRTLGKQGQYACKQEFEYKLP